MLVYDMQALAVHFFPPTGTEDRERRVVTIAELFGLIHEKRRQSGPKWKRYYQRHRQKEIARQTRYRAAHRDEVREYNRHYYRSRKQRRTTPPGQAVLIQDVAKCST